MATKLRVGQSMSGFVFLFGAVPLLYLFQAHWSWAVDGLSIAVAVFWYAVFAGLGFAIKTRPYVEIGDGLIVHGNLWGFKEQVRLDMLTVVHRNPPFPRPGLHLEDAGGGRVDLFGFPLREVYLALSPHATRPEVMVNPAARKAITTLVEPTRPNDWPLD